jgi:hypothetical protein
VLCPDDGGAMIKEFFFVSLLLALPLLILALVWLILRRKNKQFVALVVFLVGLHYITSIIQMVASEFGRSNAFGYPMDLFRLSITVIIGVLIAFRFFSLHILSGYNSGKIPDYSMPAVLRESVGKILDSEHFLTALRSTLPKGEGDERFGFDYIPFLLSSIDDRRKRAVKSARFF